MKFFVVFLAIIAAAYAAPSFGLGGFGASGSAAQAGASSQTFNQGGGFGYPGGYGGGFSGSSANAAASSQSFNQVRRNWWKKAKSLPTVKLFVCLIRALEVFDQLDTDTAVTVKADTANVDMDNADLVKEVLVREDTEDITDKLWAS